MGQEAEPTLPAYSPDGEYLLTDMLAMARNGDEGAKGALRLMTGLMTPEESGIVREIINSGIDLEPTN